MNEEEQERLFQLTGGDTKAAKIAEGTLTFFYDYKFEVPELDLEDAGDREIEVRESTDKSSTDDIFSYGPNPFTDELVLNYRPTNIYSLDKKLIITTVNGSVMKELTLSKDQEEYHIVTSSWATGMYFILRYTSSDQYKLIPITKL